MTVSDGISELEALRAYSRGEIAAVDLRRRLNDATYGEILLRLRDAKLPLPRAPVAGREEHLARAREWLFPRHDT